ncbi:hypothetical protein BVY04_02625 [bacterium M21]|nr:hypothetical protein BVY04_02625 [bacterium M21]
MLYQVDGALDVPYTKQAYLDMMVDFGYPVPAKLKTDEFWICDFLQRDMEKLGMGGVLWINEAGEYGKSGAKEYSGKAKGQKFGYLGHEIYLLPGQMLPEHRHIGGAGGFSPKMEAWHIRHGSVEFFGQYDSGSGETLISEMPESERPWGYGESWFKAKYVKKSKAGEVYKLADPESWHFQRAGKDGAIVTEYGTNHNHVEFSKPGMAFKCSAKK